MTLLPGRRALVTGAGSGIGRATCERLAGEGAAVAALDVDADAARAVAGDVGGIALVADVADPAALEAALRAGMEALGGIDILVNNAGVGAVRAFDRYGDEEYGRIVDTSMRATYVATSVVGPAMVAAGSGAVCNVASVSGIRPTRGEAPYSAAKAAVIALTASAALEYGPAVRVNCVSPGVIDTPLTAPLLASDGVRAAIEAGTPLRRAGTAGEVATVIAFLCSDLASYVTGVNLPVDGGSLVPSAQVDGVLAGIVAWERRPRP